MSGTVVRVKGIKRYFSKKSGRWYCYHRATGKPIEAEFGSPAFFERLAKLDRQAREQAERKGKPQTLKDLILSYKSTDNFADKAVRTRSDYEKAFAFLEPLWSTHIRSFATPEIAALRNEWRKTRGRRFVNYVRSVLSILFGHAIELGIVSANPVRDVQQIRRPRDARPLNRPWSLAERQAVLAHLPPHLRLPVAIGLYTGMREGDMLRLPRNIVSNGRINIITSKRLVPIDIHVLPDLHAALREAPHHDAITLCANSRGQPWTQNGFLSSFRKELKKLEKRGLIEAGLTFHGLRHTVATVLAEAGVSAEDIASVLGQRSSQMDNHYARLADRSRRSTAAIQRLKPLEGKN